MSLPFFQLRSWWTAAVCYFAVTLLTACTISVESDCASDDDCGAHEYCSRGGGILVRDGVCVAHTLSDDAGSQTDADAQVTSDADAQVPSDADDAGDTGADVDEPCSRDQDCEPTTEVGDWSDCRVDGEECTEVGERTREVIHRQCGADNRCQASIEEEVESCSVDDGALICEVEDLCATGVCEGDHCVATPICSGQANECGCQDCEDCTASDGWRDVGTSYRCCDESQACECQDREYREFSCTDGQCEFTVVDTDRVVQDCSPCLNEEVCDNGQCSLENPYLLTAVDAGALIALGQTVDDHLLDLSGNDHHGSLNGGAQWEPAGGPTAELRGYIHHDPAQESFTEIAAHPDLEISGSHTVAYWRRRHAPLEIDFEADMAKGNDSFQIRANNSNASSLRYTLRAGLEPGAPQGEDDTEVVTPTGTLLIDSWQFVVATYDQAQGQAKLFVDDMDEPIATTARDTDIATNSIPITLAGWDDGFHPEGPGEMDRFSPLDITGFVLFDIALDSEQRNALRAP